MEFFGVFFISIAFSFLILCNIFGHAYSLSRLLNIKSNLILTNFIIGSLSIIFFSYSINFFFPLKQFITNSLFVFFTTIGLIFIISNFRDYLIQILITSIIVSVITIFSTSYNDYELYHLPYMEIIRKFKIIFGLSNLDFRYAHTAVFQNISAFQYNSLMGIDSYLFYTPILFTISLGFILKKIINTNINEVYFIGLVSTIYFIIHGSRYGSLGNDYPAHILAIISLILFLQIKNNHSNSVSEQFLMLSIILILVLSKFSLIFFIILPIYLILKKKILINLKIIFLIILGLLFLSKNVINSSCLVYPISNLCFQTQWSTHKYSFGSPEIVSIESGAVAKAYLDSNYLNNPDKIKEFKNIFFKDKKNLNNFNNLSENMKKEFFRYHNYKNYSKIVNWFPEYLNSKDFFKLIKNIIFLNLLIYVICYFYFKFSKSSELNSYTFTQYLKKNIFFILFISFNSIFWLISFPQVRFGLSYILVFSLFPTLIKFRNYDISIFKSVLLKYLLILPLIYALYENANRISTSIFIDEFDDVRQSIVILKSKKNFKTIKINESHDLRQPIGGVCSDIEQFCTVFTEQFIGNSRKIHSKYGGYFFIY